MLIWAEFSPFQPAIWPAHAGRPGLPAPLLGSPGDPLTTFRCGTTTCKGRVHEPHCVAHGAQVTCRGLPASAEGSLSVCKKPAGAKGLHLPPDEHFGAHSARPSHIQPTLLTSANPGSVSQGRRGLVGVPWNLPEEQTSFPHSFPQYHKLLRGAGQVRSRGARVGQVLQFGQHLSWSQLP